jgi:hypothetical protein
MVFRLSFLFLGIVVVAIPHSKGWRLRRSDFLPSCHLRRFALEMRIIDVADAIARQSFSIFAALDEKISSSSPCRGVYDACGGGKRPTA